MDERQSVTYRQAGPDDAKSIAIVKIASWREAYKNIVPEPHLRALSVKAESAKLRFYLQASLVTDTKFIVAEINDEIVGFVTLGAARDDMDYAAEIYAIYIAPDHYRNGIGTALFDQSITYIKEKKWHDIGLRVLETNKMGIKFYKKMGMIHCKDSDKETIIANETMIEQLYKKEIIF